MVTTSGEFGTLVGGQVYSWIDEPSARAAAPVLRGRSILSDLDLSRAEVDALVETALWLKVQRERGQPHLYLAGKTLGMLFQHPSTRTRNAFQAGMEQLGGHATFLGAHDLQLTRGETLPDTAQILSRYVDGIAARFGAHEDLITFMGGASVPVFNALTERFHPIEALSDLLTLHDRLGGLKGLKLAYMGDGNNVCHSLMLSGTAAGMHVAVASPVGFEPDATLVARARELAAQSGGSILVTPDPVAAATGADAIYTDVHESMGQPDDPHKRVALAPYKVTTELMGEARPTAVFMHCLPMQRDVEVEAAVADGPQSIVFEQAANRLHMHKAVLLLTMG
ncbi:MAG: ornithine carbamoyltransferase [Thermomicrobiales bacterium]|jgi:ornithine carbamoyltransferase|nr:ornithine carbamoyltransferase [Thermomicrobiales bacterium]MDF3037598.1 ornithine carbamoyltransferase [Thermomicrobiales bacterium]